MVCASELVSALAVLLGAQTAAMLTPGPNMLLLLGTAELRVRMLKYTVAGFATAGLVFSIASIAALHLTHDGSMDAARRVLQLLGALYLVHVGVGLVRSACASMGRDARPGGELRPDTGASLAARHVASARPGTLFLTGFATNASNPKTLAFFGSILTIYAGHVGAGGPALGLAVVAIFLNSVLVHTLIGRALRTAPARRGYARWGSSIRLATGLLFVAIGIGFGAAAAAGLAGPLRI